MKITNKTIGYLVVLALAAAAHYCIYLGTYFSLFDLGGLPYPALLLSWVYALLFYAIGLILLFNGTIQFSLTIPVPLANYRAALKERKELTEAVSEKYRLMAKAEGRDFERLHDEAQVIEKRLEKLEA